jgi:multiple sugar transport system substrate-binding protein
VTELELSLIWRQPEALANALQVFEAQHNVRVHVQVLDPTQEQRQLTDFAIFSTGPDVSEVGSTWLSSLMSMNALRPFKPQEVHALGGREAFFPVGWQAGERDGDLMAAPWRADTRVIYYRRDLLQQAGIDERSAFATVDDLQRTLARLRTLPGVIPCGIPTNRHPMVLHVLAPYVWGAGGHFMRQDGQKTLFAEPKALAGVVEYFNTFAPVLTPAVQGLPDSDVAGLFAAGKVAVTVSGHWLLDVIRKQQVAAPQVMANLGVALTPGAQYTGGMNLVIWKHTRSSQLAFELVRFLTQQEFQTTYSREAEYLPALRQALNSPPFSTDPEYHFLSTSLQSGRAFGGAYMWGLVEDRLTTTIYELWQQIFVDPRADWSNAVAHKLKSIAERLDRTFASG